MGIIFGPDTFTVGANTNIDEYPSVGSPNYAYSRSSGSDVFVAEATDRVECAFTAIRSVVRCINPAVPQEMVNVEVRADLRHEGASTLDNEPGFALRYSTTTRGYVGHLRLNLANEIQILEDDGGYTQIANVDRGLLINTTYAASFRAVGSSNGTLLTLIIGGTVALTTTETSAPASGAPGISDERDSSGGVGAVDNFLVDDLAGFPLVAGMIATNGTAATTSAVVNIPSGIKAGETILVLIRNAAGGTITFPGEGTSYVQLFEDSSDASNDTTALAWRKADGTEGSTITVTFGTSGKFAAIAYRILNAADPTVRPPEFATLVTGTSTTPDPGTVTPTGGSKKYLFIWMGGWENEQTSPPAGFPTNYNSPIGADSGAAGAVTTNCRVACAYREAEASSEDPGSWTIDVSDDWTATVVAIHPIGAAEFMPAVLEEVHSGGWIGGGDI